MAGYIKKAAATAKARAKTTKPTSGSSSAVRKQNADWNKGYRAGQAAAQKGKLIGAEGPKQSKPRRKSR